MKSGSPALVLLLLVLSIGIAFADLTVFVGPRVEIRNTRTVGLGPVTDRQLWDDLRYFSNGTIASVPQADLAWHTTTQIASGAQVVLNLRSGLVDTFGAPLAFAKLRVLGAQNLGSTTITIAGDPAAPAGMFLQVATAGIVLPGSASVLLSCPITGFPVASGSSDQILIKNASGGTGTYRLLLIGNSQ